jgi:hypothetical protein
MELNDDKVNENEMSNSDKLSAKPEVDRERYVGERFYGTSSRERESDPSSLLPGKILWRSKVCKGIWG